jgi:hypothetical protein
VVHEILVVDLLIKVGHVLFECHLETTGRVAMREVQVPVRLPGVTALRKFVADVFNTIIFEMLEQQLVTHEDPIDVEQKRLDGHLVSRWNGYSL